jgi:hypothetical protein
MAGPFDKQQCLIQATRDAPVSAGKPLEGWSVRQTAMSHPHHQAVVIWLGYAIWWEHPGAAELGCFFASLAVVGTWGDHPPSGVVRGGPRVTRRCPRGSPSRTALHGRRPREARPANGEPGGPLGGARRNEQAYPRPGASPYETGPRANGDIKDHFFFIKSQGDKRRAQRLALAREAPGPPKRALTKISTAGTYLEAGFRGQIQIRRNQGRSLISRKSYVWLRSSVTKRRIGTCSGSIDSSRRARRAQHFAARTASASARYLPPKLPSLHLIGVVPNILSHIRA